MSKHPKMVLEGAKWVSRTILSTDKDDVDFFWTFMLKHVKKDSFMHEYVILSTF